MSDNPYLQFVRPPSAPSGDPDNPYLQFVPKPPLSPGLGESIVRGAAQAVSGINEGLAQGFGAIPDAAMWAARQAGVPERFAPGGVRDALSRWQRTPGLPPGYTKPNGPLEAGLHGAGEGVGQAIPLMLGGAALGGVSAAGSIPARIGNALSAQPGGQVIGGAAGGGVTEATGNPYAGLAAALMAPMAAGGALRAIGAPGGAPNPERAALVAAARREGIPLTSGQATGSRPQQYVESAFRSLPFTSGAELAREEAQKRAFTAASLARSGTASDVASPDVLKATRDRLGGQFTDLSARNTLQVTPGVRSALEQMADDAGRFLAPDAAGPVRARIDQVLSHPDGANIPGQFYRQLDSQLGRSIRSTSNGDVRAALGDLRDTLRVAMDLSISPRDQAAWQQARRQYANLMVSANAVGGAGEGAALGQISPLALRGAVNRSTGRNYAFGAGDQNELARMGQALLRPPPDSGTAQRSWAMNALTGGGGGGLGMALSGGDPVSALAGALAGQTVLPRVAQAAYYNPGVQRWLTDGIPALHGTANAMPQVDRALVAAILANQGPAALAGPRQ